jgi:hypothetical protein
MTKKALFLKAYENNLGHITDSCKAVKISRNAYYEWLKDDPKFKKDIEDIENSFINLTECQLRKNVKKGIQKAIEFTLTNLKKDKYNNNQQLEVIMPKVVKETVFVQSGEPPKIVEEEPKVIEK